MSTLDLTLYEALVSANVPKETAQTVVRELNVAIDQRYQIHSKELATRGDVETLNLKIDALHKDIKIEMAELKAEMIKWYLGSSIAIAGVVIAAIKLF